MYDKLLGRENELTVWLVNNPGHLNIEFRLRFYHPHIVIFFFFHIGIYISAFFHPHFMIRILSSGICLLPSAPIRSTLYRDPHFPLVILGSTAKDKQGIYHCFLTLKSIQKSWTLFYFDSHCYKEKQTLNSQLFHRKWNVGECGYRFNLHSFNYTSLDFRHVFL